MKTRRFVVTDSFSRFTELLSNGRHHKHWLPNRGKHWPKIKLRHYWSYWFKGNYRDLTAGNMHHQMRHGVGEIRGNHAAERWWNHRQNNTA